MSTHVGRGRLVFGDSQELPCFYVLHITGGGAGFSTAIEGRVTLEKSPQAGPLAPAGLPELVLEDGRRITLLDRVDWVEGESVRVALRGRATEPQPRVARSS